MKKVLIIGLATLIFTIGLCGCGNKPTTPTLDSKSSALEMDEKIQIDYRCSLLFVGDVVGGIQSADNGSISDLTLYDIIKNSNAMMDQLNNDREVKMSDMKTDVGKEYLKAVDAYISNNHDLGERALKYMETESIEDLSALKESITNYTKCSKDVEGLRATYLVSEGFTYQEAADIINGDYN